jgi:hypothetical protein
MTTEEFRNIIANIVVRIGSTNIPSEPEFLMLYDTTKNYFPYNTIGELILAVELNETGLYWERVNAYNLISIKFISDIGKQYNEYKRKMVTELKKKESCVSNDKLLSQEPVVINYKEMLQRDVEMVKKGNSAMAIILAPFMMDALVKKEAFTDDLLTESQWEAFTEQARASVKKERREKMLRIDKEKMSEIEYLDYKHQVIAERKRIIYKFVLSTPSILEKIIKKLS